MKKFIGLMLVSIFLVLALVACAGNNEVAPAGQPPAAAPDTAQETPTPTPEPTPEPEPVQFVLEYPEDMHEHGFTEALILDQPPERVAVMSVGSVIALYELGVNIVAVPSTGVIEYPETLLANAIELPGVMAEAFDIEMVVAAEPDLVIIPFTVADTHGATLQALGIPVYFVNAGHVVPYASIRMQTDAFINAWATDAAAAALAVEQRFVYVEARLEEISERTEGMTVMVIQGGVQLQTAMGTLGGMLNQLGFTNVSNAPGAMVLIDFEQALYYDPDWVFFVGSQATPQEVEDYMATEMANNQSYWDAIPAVYEGRVIFLGTPFISSAGLGVVDRLNDLIDIVNSVVLED